MLDSQFLRQVELKNKTKDAWTHLPSLYTGILYERKKKEKEEGKCS